MIHDFNCDGKLDVATVNYNGNDVSVLMGNGDGTFQPKLNFAAGSFSWSLAVGDFEGNGKASLAVANNFAKDVSILLNTTAVLPGVCH